MGVLFVTLRQQIKSSQEYNKEVSQALEVILKNGLRSLTRGLEEWNLEDRIILYRSQVYVPRNDTLRCKIVKHYHDHVATGHPGRWKTYCYRWTPIFLSFYFASGTYQSCDTYLPCDHVCDPLSK